MPASEVVCSFPPDPAQVEASARVGAQFVNYTPGEFAPPRLQPQADE